MLEVKAPTATPSKNSHVLRNNYHGFITITFQLHNNISKNVNKYSNIEYLFLAQLVLCA